MRHSDVDPRVNAITADIVDAAIAVHRGLGPGLMESTYSACMRLELEARGHEVLTELTVPVSWRGRTLTEKLRLDLLVDGLVPVEIKSAEPASIHRAQLRTYVRLLEKDAGLLLNFNHELMKDGITRVTAASSGKTAHFRNIELLKLDGSAIDPDAALEARRNAMETEEHGRV